MIILEQAVQYQLVDAIRMCWSFHEVKATLDMRYHYKGTTSWLILGPRHIE